MKSNKRTILLGSALLGFVFMTGCSKDDTVAPTLSLTGDANLTYSLPASGTAAGTWTDPGFTANDDQDGSVSSQVTVSGANAVNLGRKGVYTVTYSVSDKAGNTTSATRTINVVNDAEIFAGTYANSVDSCTTTPSSQFSATLATSDTINRLVKISNFGAYGNTISIWATITGSSSGSAVNIDNNQSLGGNAYITNIYHPNSAVVSGTAPTSFTVKYAWTDGSANDVCTSLYVR